MLVTPRDEIILESRFTKIRSLSFIESSSSLPQLGTLFDQTLFREDAIALSRDRTHLNLLTDGAD